RDGDTVLVDAGEYADACRWTANDLVIRGVGGYAHVRDRTTAGKAIWVIQGNNTTVEWIEFSGATVQDCNGAGIRQEGADLTVRHCFFHDNENGILAGDNAQSRILIEHSRFARNGYGDGYSHNMYINHVAEFTIRYSFVEAAKVGHNVKSRAFRTFILCNGITSGDGTTSREIDLPNGGLAVVAGNVIVHGSATQNSNLLGYGLEGLSNPIHSLFVTHNTFVTARGAGLFVQLPGSGTDTLVMRNNIFAGRASAAGGDAALLDTAANLLARDPADARFSDVTAFEYTPLAGSPAVDAAIAAVNVWGQPLLPEMEYVHPAGARMRVTAGAPDIGALEYRPPVSVIMPPSASTMHVEGPWPQPARDRAHLRITNTRERTLTIHVRDMAGRLLRAQRAETNEPGSTTVMIDMTGLGPGWYFCTISGGSASQQRMLLIR
ncbi:MAG: hypothetical protein KFF77_10985, partial [Bacteroidetes bacterium]|nr:hypothetical protein [Bacteroidota bacterium]